MSADRLEREVFIRAPRDKVWRAISDAKEFGAWFGVALEQPFAPGASITGKITDPPGHEHLSFRLWVERIEPTHLFTFRWHPYAIDPHHDYSQEPKTLVTFELDDAPGGTRLVVRESGFDALPPSRRDEAFLRNGQGWTIQADRVKAHVET